MLGSDSNPMTMNIVLKSMSNQMKREYSLSGSDENYIPQKKGRTGFKALVICLLVVGCVGFCLLSSPNTNTGTQHISHSSQVV